MPGYWWSPSGVSKWCRRDSSRSKTKVTLLGLAQLPDGASLQRSDEIRAEMVRLASSVPGVAYTVELTGCSGIDWSNRSNSVTVFLTLAPSSERMKDPKLNGFALYV